MKSPIATVLALVLFGCGGRDESSEHRPVNAGINILLLTVDTLRADHMSCYGYRRRTTPAIDALAARGVAFDRVFTYWPKTRASFAAMFTSLYASQNGLTVRDRDLPDFNHTLAETLQEGGYRTAAAVDNGNLDRELGFAQGFDRYEEVWVSDAETEVERTELLTRFAIDFLKGYGSPAPFFLWIHYVNPHAPYQPPEDLLRRFRGDGLIPRGAKLEPVVGFHGGVNRHLALPREAHVGDYIDRYDAEIALADREIGRVLEALKESRYRSSTMVAFTADHGESLGEHDYFFDHGYDLFQPSLHVPLILSFPGVLPAGERVSTSVSTLDLFPTLLDLAQVSFPPGIQGSSLLPLIRGSTDPLHDRIVFENDHHQLGMTNGRLKLIAVPEEAGNKVRYHLYDLARDPGETADLYPSSGARIEPFVAELERFRTRTIAWQQDTARLRKGEPPRTDGELSEETLRNLEALGYLGKGTKGEKR